MATHIDANGEFQSDKYPTCPPGKVPLSVKDPTAQDLLWQYAQRRRAVDAEFATDLESALRSKGFVPVPDESKGLRDLLREVLHNVGELEMDPQYREGCIARAVALGADPFGAADDVTGRTKKA